MRRDDDKFGTPLVLAAAAAVVIAVVFALSIRVIGYDWVLFDDDINVLLNPHLGHGGTTWVWAVHDLSYIRRYLPLGWIGFDALLRVDGYNPAVFHAASCALHALNAALAFFVFRRIAAPAAPQRTEPRAIVAATLGALLWSLHPLRAENVGWISGLLYLGSSALALTAVLLHLMAEQRENRDRDRWPTRLVAAIAYIGSLLVYPVSLAIPALLTWRAGGRAPRFASGVAREARRLAVWWIAAIAIAGLNYFALATAADGFARPPNITAQFGAIAWLQTSAYSWLHYAAKTVWPVNVAPFYGHATELLNSASSAIPAVAFGLAAAAGLARRATRRAAIAIMGAGLIALLPFLAQADLSFHAADRFAVVWLAVMGCTVVIWIGQADAWRRRALVGLAAAVACAVLYERALPKWQNTFTLQASIDAATLSHPDPKLDFTRPALAFWMLGARDDAMARIEQGKRLFPQSVNLTETEQLIAELERNWRGRVGSHTEIPPLAVQHVDLGNGALRTGAAHNAAAHFARAVALAPSYAAAIRGYRAAEANRPGAK